ncbi:CAF17-like 4Fe-4S cluster assembly/insertion protein YgfZ [Hylemonella gracilis]|uniref:Glycine cleavage T protein (Aminomethyltransferase) n=1 Tax=Hylemonella gracilis ATCC 19624 TaxID=887062 RepID=F3KNX8_9BURK|nr:folate-binding protein YgfZ [Hylemonella gracilis]EGI78555.1 glycine cleavage T protein (aminomethyltransferase) [Hylemonella gracilis ATCC 19624]
MNPLLNGISPLPHLGVLRASGEEATKFLQSQLTNDFALLGANQARFAAFCSAQGRMQASFIGVKLAADDILLVCSQDLLERTLKRLSMFVLRAKVKLSDATASFALYGLAGDAVQAHTPGAGALPAPWTCQSVNDETRLIHLHPAVKGDDRAARALWLAPATTPAPEATALAHEDWLWGEVLSGVAMVSAPTFEAFVPQMLNYESIEGINFKKGCYPGQEVVARSQFRGAIKRRALRVRSPVALSAGQDIFDAAAPEEACGVVAQAAKAPQGQRGSPEGGFDAIVVLQLAHAQAQLQTADGAALTSLPLPYALREDI